MSSNFGPPVSVSNFDEVRLALRKELTILSQKLEKAMKDASDSKQISSMDLMRIQELVQTLKQIASIYQNVFENINFTPEVTVNVPEIRLPDINVPEIVLPEIKIPDVYVSSPQVTVNPTDVTIDLSRLLEALEPLRLLSDKPSSAISVRLSDGKRFIEAMKEVSKGQDKMVQVFSSAQPGLTSDEYKEIIKSTSDVTSVSGSASSVTLLAANQNRKGFMIFNDSTAILYVKLGATASTSSFTYRLTPYGIVSEPNFRYTGVIDGIWASATGSARITNLT
jgi:hypothetical protein